MTATVRRMHHLPWLRPAPDSAVGRSMAQGQSPWLPAMHLMWSVWVFVTPLAIREGLTPAWIWRTAVSYPLFLLLFFFAQVLPRRRLIFPAALMIALCVVLLPSYPSALSYFIYGCIYAAFAMEPRLRQVIGSVLVTNALLIVWARAHGYPYFTLVWMPVTTLAITVINHFEERSARQLAVIQASQDEIRRIAALAERERISRDLHDLLGHTLSMVALKSELASRLMAHDSPKAKAEIAEVALIARQTLNEVRQAVSGMRSTALAAELASARVLLAADDITLETHLDALPLQPEAESTLAWVLREAITNVQRHAHARMVRVRLQRAREGVQLHVHDDGSGDAPREGNGLAGMRSRLQAQGGSLRLERANGLHLIAQLPLECLA